VETEVEVLARIKENLLHHPLAGFVAEGGTPYGHMGPATDAALRRATCLGMPVVKVSRGNADGMVPAERMRMAIAGNNLTATKARLLLMACLMRFGSLPLAADPDNPTADEVAAIEARLRDYQAVFLTH
jgi:L-asparaginase/Glu-tRNA(Gln) amidotransferase subunit D